MKTASITRSVLTAARRELNLLAEGIDPYLAGTSTITGKQ